MIVHSYIKKNSVRVPGKNYATLNGKPLWRIMLEKFWGYEFYLDTDDPALVEEIHGDSNLPHCHAYLRLPEHAVDPNPGLAMTRRFLTEFVEDPVAPIVLVHCTSPFLKAETVINAHSRVAKGPWDSAAATISIRDFCYLEEGQRLTPVNHDGVSIPATQDLPPVRVLNHGFYVFSKASLARTGHRLGSNPLLCDLTYPERIDIDWPEDLELAKAWAHYASPTDPGKIVTTHSTDFAGFL
jgi:CMP-N-acetylneuraminic acid synthetase